MKKDRQNEKFKLDNAACYWTKLGKKLANNIAMHVYYLLLSTKDQGDGEEERTHTKADDLLLVWKWIGRGSLIMHIGTKVTPSRLDATPSPSSPPPPS
jgi:hypothetical protein